MISEALMETLLIKPRNPGMTGEQLGILIAVLVLLALFLTPAFIAAYGWVQDTFIPWP